VNNPVPHGHSFLTSFATVDPCHFPIPERVGIPSAFHCAAIFFQLTPLADSFLAWRIRAATRLRGSVTGGSGRVVTVGVAVGSATGGEGVSESATASSGSTVCASTAPLTASAVGLSMGSPIMLAASPVELLVMVESIASTRSSRVESSATVSVSSRVSPSSRDSSVRRSPVRVASLPVNSP
jgi:hypothetical protein